MGQDKKTALITGATTGIGHELARCFAKDGYNLVIVARTQEALDKVSQEIHAEFKTDVYPIALDLFEKDAAKQLYDQVKDKNLQVDVLVNDAGQGQWGKFWETDLERQLELIQLNISTVVSLTHYFLKEMVERNEGKILNVGSMAGIMPAPLLGVYGATKAFINSFSEALHNELKDTKVTVTVLMPGATESRFWEKADARDTKAGMSDKDTPESVAQAAFEALMKGEAKVIPGFINNVQALANNVIPDQKAADSFRDTMQKVEK